MIALMSLALLYRLPGVLLLLLLTPSAKPVRSVHCVRLTANTRGWEPMHLAGCSTWARLACTHRARHIRHMAWRFGAKARYRKLTSSVSPLGRGRVCVSGGRGGGGGGGGGGQRTYVVRSRV